MYPVTPSRKELHMPHDEHVLYEVNDAVATITLNRPAARNAINEELHRAVSAAFERARDDGEVRAIVLTGAGKGFCAGADLAVFATLPSPEDVYTYIVANYQPL